MDVRYFEQQGSDILQEPTDELCTVQDRNTEVWTRKICARIVKLWETRSSEGERQQADTLGPDPQETLTKILSSPARYVAEFRICDALLAGFPEQFIRSLETAKVDGAVLRTPSFTRGQTSLERHTQLQETSEGPLFLPVEVKSISISHPTKDDYYCDFIIKAHSDVDGVLILVSAMTPERLVICPTNVVTQYCRSDSGDSIHGRRTLSLGSCNAGDVTAFPLELQPYEVHVIDLVEVVQTLLDYIYEGATDW